jgi:hypothetical protein
MIFDAALGAQHKSIRGSLSNAMEAGLHRISTIK